MMGYMINLKCITKKKKIKITILDEKKKLIFFIIWGALKTAHHPSPTTFLIQPENQVND
jgi:hypothetical protein